MCSRLLLKLSLPLVVTEALTVAGLMTTVFAQSIADMLYILAVAIGVATCTYMHTCAYGFSSHRIRTHRLAQVYSSKTHVLSDVCESTNNRCRCSSTNGTTT